MTDKIAYVITSSGQDGMGKTTTIFASFDENERDMEFEGSKNKNYFRKTKVIVEIEATEKKGLAKLDGLERLVMDIDQREIK